MSFDFSLLPPSGNSIGQVLTFSVKKKERKIKTNIPSIKSNNLHTKIVSIIKKTETIRQRKTNFRPSIQFCY